MRLWQFAEEWAFPLLFTPLALLLWFAIAVPRQTIEFLTANAANLVAMFVGALISLFVSRLYYEKASIDLRKESGALVEETIKVRKLVNMLGLALHANGAIHATVDKDGCMVGFDLPPREITGAIALPRVSVAGNVNAPSPPPSSA